MGVCAYVSVIINPLTSRLVIACVYVKEALTKVIKKNELRDVCLCRRPSESMGVCLLSSLHSPVDSYSCVYVCMYVNTAERLQIHKAVVLLLIMKSLYSHITTPCNLINKWSTNSPTKKIACTTHSLHCELGSTS